MKTTLKTLTVFAGLLLLAACAAQAGDTPAQVTCPNPGWRHEQMVQARVNTAERPCGMTQRGPGNGAGFGPGYAQGMRGFGPPTNADGSVDVSKLPAWCPHAKAVAEPKTE